MAKYRAIHIQFFRSESVNLLPRDARLLFAGLIVHANDEGRLTGNLRMLKNQIFPLDEDVTVDEIERWLVQIEAEKMIVRYERDGRRFVWIPKFPEYQKLRKDRIQPSEIPPPPPPARTDSHDPDESQGISSSVNEQQTPATPAGAGTAHAGGEARTSDNQPPAEGQPNDKQSSAGSGNLVDKSRTNGIHLVDKSRTNGIHLVDNVRTNDRLYHTIPYHTEPSTKPNHHPPKSPLTGGLDDEEGIGIEAKVPLNPVDPKGGADFERHLLQWWGRKAKVSAMIMHEFMDLARSHGWEAVYKAVEEAAVHDARNIAYVRAILDPSKRRDLTADAFDRARKKLAEKLAEGGAS